MYEYQPTIKEDDYSDPHEHSENPQRMTINLARSFQARTAINQTNLSFCDVVKLWIDSPGKKGPEDKAVNFPHPVIPSDAPNRWCFAPKEEKVIIGWEIKGRPASDVNVLANAITLKLELFTRNDPQPFWVKTMKWKVGECKKRGQTDFNGVLNEDLFKTATGKTKPTEDVTIKFTPGTKFPDGILTVDHSPYKLKLSIVDGGENRRQVAKWVYIDVLVDSLELDWGKIASLPPRTDIIDPVNLEKVCGHKKNVADPNDKDIKGYEEVILDELKAANPKPVKDVVHEVKLTSNLFAFQPKGQENKESFERNTDFTTYKALWGDGARIPLEIKAFIKTSQADGKTDKVPEALGNSKILWDWNDKKADRWKDALTNGKAPKTEPFLDEGYKKNNDAKPVALSNCPKDFGGKRGDDTKAANVFPEQASGGAFPYVVTDCAVRKWSALSSFGTAEKRDKSGVIFQPSRMAGDAYLVKAYLHFDRDGDTEDDITAPPPIQTDGVLFKVFRRIQLNSLVRGRAKMNKDPNTLETDLKNSYRTELDMVVDVKQTAVDNNAYIAALQEAIKRICTREHFVDEVKDIPHLPLLARYAIEPNPPADSAGIVYRSWADISRDLEQKFRNSSLRVVDTLTNIGAFLDEDIVGKASGATGTLWKVDVRRYVLFTTPFRLAEQVEGKASKANGNLSLTQYARSSWGHKIDPVWRTERDDKIYKECIKVRFPDGNEVVAKYKKLGITRGFDLSPDLSESAKEDLSRAFHAAWLAHNESNSFDITYYARNDSTNAQLRARNLKDYLESFFTEDKIVDRKAVFNEVLAKIKTAFIGADAKRHQKTLALLLVGEITWEYARTQLPDEEGIFNLHIPGLYKGYSFADANAANAVEIKMPKVMGAFFPELTGDTNSKPFVSRDRGIVYLATVADGVADTSTPTKTVESIFKHELAHSLFLPHSPSRPAKRSPQPYPLCHVKGDKCLMNYELDTEHFCGMCMMRVRGWNWQAPVLENAIASIQILDGDDNTYLTANGIQYVNITPDDKWVDGAIIRNKHRLGRKLKVKVEFKKEIAGKNVYVQLLAHHDNSVYKASEKNAKPSFNFSPSPAASAIGNFDQDQVPLVTGQTNDEGDFYHEFELPAAVGNKFMLYAEDDDGNRVTSIEITTWRLLYYMIITAGVTPHSVPPATFRGVIEPVYTTEFTRLVHLGDEVMNNLHPVADHQYVDPIAPIEFAKLVEVKCGANTTTFPAKKYTDFFPYIARFAFTDQLASSEANKPTLPVNAPIGVGNPVVRIPVKFSPPPVAQPLTDMRKPLWIGFGKSIMDGSKTTVDGNHWFISASVTFPDGTVTPIPEANCTPVVDPNRPGRFWEIDVRVDNIPAHQPTGDISLKVVFVNRMVAGMARPGGSKGTIILSARMHFEVRSHNNQTSAGIHELGHALGMVSIPSETGIEEHATYYKSDGGHCWTGLARQAQHSLYQKDPNAAANAQCVMFGFIASPPRHTFCANCQEVFKKIDASAGLL